MKEIWLMTEKYIPEIADRLALHEQDLLVETERIGSYAVFSCRFRNLDCLEQQLVDYLANVLAELTIEDLENNLLAKFLDQESALFFPDEQGEVMNQIEQLLVEETVRKEILLQQAKNYLLEETDFVVEGFLAFRLQEYRLYLQKIVKRSIESFIVKREYQEFITFLRYFVEMQEAKFDEVHVLLFQDKGFQILDRQGNLIKNEGIDEVAVDFLAEKMEENDFLISTLITLSPEKIIFHGHDEKEIVEMVQRVFGQKVSICYGCALCRDWSKQS